MSKYRVLIGDDHEHARAAIKIILGSDPAFHVIGEATNGKEMIQLCKELLPDLVLMDINMPVLNGLDATRILKEELPHIKIVMVTVSDDVADLFEALKKGAQGYLLKNLNPSIWLDYLHAIMKDDAPISKEIAKRILTEFMSQPKTQQEHRLTSREQEILSLVALGNSNKDIAHLLTISEYTVKNHLKNIMQKLHVSNRVQLTRFAFEQGYMST
ncbi:two component transcriptional regulator, LuxR family [Thermoactinomyces sp. DSM 45891]|uniref:response regulator n=1 Tax=Thermoactinomyces sp. DSM 45891 TaxID=1761907 RepID=UPI000922DB19|nr:response regulator transcription factor [Thermoactinomyces sp. DSM 45891]SFX39400.1 two component transcriptional regulator, LuxR family [Thermoactinomyces sp. DSM 45891]